MGLLSLILLLPMLGAFVLGFVPMRDSFARALAHLFTFAALGLSVALVWSFDASQPGFQFVERLPWIPDLGIDYLLGVDGISIFLVLLTTVASACVISLSAPPHKVRGYYALMLLLESSLVGVYLALDLVLFFVLFELMLVPCYLMMNGWGGAQAGRAATRFVLYTALGSALMLSSIIYLGWSYYDQTGQLSFSLVDLAGNVRLSSHAEMILLIGFLVAFAVKTPFAPLHHWLPDAYEQAPHGLTAFMSAVMAKAGLYGIARFVWPLFPSALSSILPILIPLIALGVVYAAIIAMAQRDAKRLFAYSSVSHLSVCGLGLLLGTSISISAAVFFMVAHGIVALGIFLTLAAFTERGAKMEIIELGGLAKALPCLSVLFFFFALGSIALPLTGNFVAELLVLFSLFSQRPLVAAVTSLSVVIGAVYVLAFMRRALFGMSDKTYQMRDISFAEMCILAPLALCIFLLGIFPDLFFRRIEPSARHLESVIAAKRADSDSERSVSPDSVFQVPLDESALAVKDEPDSAFNVSRGL